LEVVGYNNKEYIAKKMSQAINLCKDSDGVDKGEWSSTNATSVPPLLLSRKRSRDEDESSNDAHHLRNENDPGIKTATGSGEFIVDMKLAGEVEVLSPHKRKRRVVVRRKRSLGAA
jgi:hypothetical protein